MTLQREGDASTWWLEAPAAACTQIKVQAELTGMEKHGIYREWVGSVQGEGGAGLVANTGGEDGVLSAGTLPINKTQLKHLGGNLWVLRPIVSHMVGRDWQQPVLGWQAHEMKDRSGKLCYRVGQSWCSLYKHGFRPTTTFYWPRDLQWVS